MQEPRCPICSAVLGVREVAPCFMCGALPTEFDHLREEQHTYAVYRIPTGTEMVLCEICFLDTDSIASAHWGLPV